MTKSTNPKAKPRHNQAFKLVLGCSLVYLGLIVLLPLAALVLKTFNLSASEFWQIVSHPRVLRAYQITFTTAFIAAVCNAVVGLVVAWVLVRYDFFGRRMLDALIDLPFALPTAVAGIALTTLLVPEGWLGKPLAALGITAVFNSLGIVVALIFIGIPFVVRTLQPVIENLDPDVEEAAYCFGATPWLTFCRITFPEILPALITGFTLAFARALGEYGSVVFISGNMPMKTEIVPLLIITKLEQYDYAGATAIALVMLIASFTLLFILNILQWLRRRSVGQIVEEIR